MDDHKKPGTSQIYDHAANSTHSIDYEGVVVKAREGNWFKRWVKEAIHIKRKAGGGSDLPKFKFSVEFPIGLHAILQLQIKKKFKTA